MRWKGAVAGACALVVGVAGVGAGLLVARDRDPGPGAAARSAAPSPKPQPLLVPPPVLAEAATGPAQSAAAVTRALTGPLSDPRLGARVAATVLDVETGAVLLDRGARTAVTPASTAKLATAVALLSVTEPEQRLTTRVVAGTRLGEIVLVGGGDGTLSAAPAGTPTPYAGAPRIATLAAGVRKAGLPAVTRVVVDSSLFQGPAMAPGWDPVDIAGGYIAPVTATMVDAGRQGGLRARSTEPDLAAGRALAAALGVPDAVVLRGRASPGTRRLAEVVSQPVPRLVEQMLLASDNVLAELLARQVAIAEGAPASFAGAAAATRGVLGRMELPTGEAGLVDGSGMSLRNRLTTGLLAALLRHAVGTDDPGLHAVVPALPVSGYLGTLDDRFVTGPAAVAAGRVRAKTGTLTGITSLAGLVRGADGRLLAFAVVADRVPAAGQLGAEDALDLVAARLAACGCAR